MLHEAGTRHRDEGSGTREQNAGIEGTRGVERGSRLTKEPDFSRRADLAEFPELMDGPSTRDQLRECLSDLARLNRWFLAYRTVLEWLEGLRLPIHGEPIRILDVACGYGDTLRRIEQWAHEREIRLELTGLDLSADAIAIATEASENTSRIRWVAGDVFSYAPAESPYLVISSQFTHHLADEEVVRFLRWMERNALMGWFVHDLSRAPIPYHLIRWFTRVARLHPFVQNDAPVSIARAFVPTDWHRLCAAAGLAEGEYTILSYKPARLCVGRRKTR
ncbi:MAG TPA: methyltransferase domain-containing protein [Terracidiphilus sp.]|nr:methyltransferase domain-containing protein [Terracidiphilus sp.]